MLRDTPKRRWKLTTFCHSPLSRYILSLYTVYFYHICTRICARNVFSLLGKGRKYTLSRNSFGSLSKLLTYFFYSDGHSNHNPLLFIQRWAFFYIMEANRPFIMSSFLYNGAQIVFL